MNEPYVSDPKLADAAEGYDYLAAHTAISLAKRRYVTYDGLLLVIEGQVVLVNAGEGPVLDRVLGTAPVAEAEVLSKPWWGYGTSMIVRLGDTKWRVEPESVVQGSGNATPKKIRRAREAVRAFERLLEASKEASRTPDAAAGA
jgi:hypothetical protein